MGFNLLYKHCSLNGQGFKKKRERKRQGLFFFEVCLYLRALWDRSSGFTEPGQLRLIIAVNCLQVPRTDMHYVAGFFWSEKCLLGI